MLLDSSSVPLGAWPMRPCPSFCFCLRVGFGFVFGFGFSFGKPLGKNIILSAKSRRVGARGAGMREVQKQFSAKKVQIRVGCGAGFVLVSLVVVVRVLVVLVCVFN